MKKRKHKSFRTRFNHTNFVIVMTLFAYMGLNILSDNPYADVPEELLPATRGPASVIDTDEVTSIQIKDMEPIRITCQQNLVLESQSPSVRIEGSACTTGETNIKLSTIENKTNSSTAVVFPMAREYKTSHFQLSPGRNVITVNRTFEDGTTETQTLTINHKN